jgi:putative tryptophan/tyrosine transport system substrate-binding protein
MSDMRRREFITLLGGAVAWPLAASAQQTGNVCRIGYVAGVSGSAASGSYAAFVQGMRELGYIEGKDFVIEWRSVEGRHERFPEIAAELVRLKVDVFVTGVTAALPALKRATNTIPIVMAYSTDPVGNGLVASLGHPGSNITGLAGSSDDSSPKQLELLRTIVPNVSRIGLLGNPDTETYLSVLNNARDAARRSAFLWYRSRHATRGKSRMPSPRLPRSACRRSWWPWMLFSSGSVGELPNLRSRTIWRRCLRCANTRRLAG